MLLPQLPVEESGEVSSESDRGSMLNALIGEAALSETEADKNSEDNAESLGTSRSAYARLHSCFAVAKSRSLNSLCESDYAPNLRKRLNEFTADANDPLVYKNALFYMYGVCESQPQSEVLVHSHLRQQKVWSGSPDEAARCLDK